MLHTAFFRRARTLALLFVLAALAALALGMRSSAASVQTQVLDLQLRGAAGDGDDAVQIDGKNFGDVERALAQATIENPGQAILAVTPDGMATIDVDGATVTLTSSPGGDAAPYRLTARGSATFLGEPAEVLVVVSWKTAEDTAPDSAVLFRYTDIDLVTFEESFADLPVRMTDAWFGLSRTPKTGGQDVVVDPADFPDVADFLDDGVDDTDDAFSVQTAFAPAPDLITPPETASDGFSLRGTIDPNGVVAETARDLGLGTTGRLDGQVSFSTVTKETCPVSANGGRTCSSGLTGRAAPAYGFEVTASFSGGDPDTTTLPDGVRIDDGWAITFAANSLGQVKAELSGGVTVEAPGDDWQLRGSVGFAYDRFSNATTVTLGLAREDFDLAPGVPLRSLGASIQTTIVRGTAGNGTPSGPAVSDGFAGTVRGTAVVDIGSIIGEAGEGGGDGGDPGASELTFEVAITGSDAGASISLTSASTASLTDLGQVLGVNGATPPEGVAAEFSELGVSLRLIGTTATSAAQLTVTLTGSAEVGTEDLSFTADALVYAAIPFGGAEKELLVVLRSAEDSGEGFTFSQLLGAEPGDLDAEVPAFAISVATDDFDVRPEFLDPATALFVEGEDTLFPGRLLYRTGINLKASTTLPPALEEVLNGVGIETDGELRVTGQLPGFGTEAIGLSIELPRIVTTSEGPFRDGTFSLTVGRTQVAEDSSRFQTQFQLKGTGTVDVVRESAEGCAGYVPPARDPAEEREDDPCLDELEFTVSGAVLAVQSPTPSTGVELVGSLRSEDGWVDPLGVQGLQIDGLAIRVLVSVTPTGPRVDVGMLGALEINERALTVAFSFGATPRPPYIEPLGFTLATDGLGLHDLVELRNLLVADAEEVDIATLDLPDVRFEDVYLAFGVVDEPRLCIRLGFFLSAELHIGGTMGGEVPTCDQEGNIPPPDPPSAEESCAGTKDDEDGTTCVASVLIDVRAAPGITGAFGNRVIVEGFLAATELGPLQLDTFQLELELSGERQRLFLRGGATLLAPDDLSEELASGSFSIELTASTLELTAEVDFLDGGLTASITGSAAFDLDDPAFELTTHFTAPALDQLAEDVEADLVALADSVDEHVALLDATAAATGEELVTSLDSLGEELLRALDPAALDLSAAVDDARRFLRDANRALVAVGLDPLPTDEILTTALEGVRVPLLEPVPGFRVEGTCVFVEVDGSCFLTTGADLVLPGLCDLPGNGDARVCDGTPGIRGVLQEATLTSFADDLDDLGLALSELGNPLVVLTTLDEALDADEPVVVECATTTLDYGADTRGPVVTVIDVLGTRTTAESADVTGAALFTATVGAIVADEPATACTTPPSLPEAPDAIVPTAGFQRDGAPVDRVTEGDSVMLAGTAAPDASVIVDWGDGTAATTTADADGDWSAEHRYVDDRRARATATTDDGAVTARLLVLDADPVLDVTFPTTADEGAGVALRVAITDAGVLDRHDVRVDWGDDTVSTTSTVGTDGALVIVPHVYADEGTPMVTVTVTDATRSTGRAVATGNVAVANVAPIVTLVPLGGTTIDEGAATTWTVSVDDPGVEDAARVELAWGDGTSEVLLLDITGAVTRTVDVTHTWADDAPSGTPEDPAVVTVDVDDLDGGAGDVTVPITLRNVAPTVVDPPSTIEALLHAPVVLPGVTVTDPGFSCDPCGSVEEFVAELVFGPGSQMLPDGTAVPIDSAAPDGPDTLVVEVTVTPGAVGTPTTVTTAPVEVVAREVGTSAVSVTVTDDDGATATANFQLRVLGPRDLLTERLLPLLAPYDDDKDVARAIDDLEDAAYRLDRWVDAQLLDGKQGDQVLQDLRTSAKDLEKAIKNGVGDDDLREALDLHETIGSMLVTSQIRRAESVDADPKYLDKAREHVADAALEAEEGEETDRVIKDLRDAWKDAEKAARKATRQRLESPYPRQ